MDRKRWSGLALAGFLAASAAGCGGGNKIGEGVPTNVEDEAKRADEQFRKDQEAMGKAMMTAEPPKS